MKHDVSYPALVLAAGLGTRCRPLTFVRAKPAFPLAGETVVRRLLKYIRSHGTKRAVINLHHKPETIEAAVAEGRDLGLQVSYSREPVILGSAGGPKHALALIDAPRFIIINGDTLCPIDIRALVESHERSGAQVTMALVPNPDPARYSSVYVDDEGRVRCFGRSCAGSEQAGWRALHFVGIQAVEASVFEPLAADRHAESVKALYPQLMARHEGAVRAFESSAPFHDVGTPADYLAAALAVSAQEGLQDLPTGRRVSISPGATVARTAIWDDVTVGEDCRLTECVVADGVRLPAGTRLERSAVVRREDLPAALAARIASGFYAAPLDSVPRAGADL
ncbi:MAG: sugar phosphate nucleotidyltransferase [Vicinamibacterales bacterium]